MAWQESRSTHELGTAARTCRISDPRTLPHIAVEECSGGHRQSLVEYLIDDTKREKNNAFGSCPLTMTVEDEFFRRRSLSLGDFDGTREFGMCLPAVVLLTLTGDQHRLEDHLKDSKIIHITTLRVP